MWLTLHSQRCKTNSLAIHQRRNQFNLFLEKLYENISEASTSRDHRRRSNRLQCGISFDKTRLDRCRFAGTQGIDLRHNLACGRTRGSITGDKKYDKNGAVHERTLCDLGGGNRTGDGFQTKWFNQRCSECRTF